MIRLSRSTMCPFRIALLLVFAAAGFGGCSRSDTSAASPEIQFNTKIAFGQSGNSDAYKVSGWNKTEEKFTWSEGTSARLRGQLPPAQEAVALKVRAAALTKPPELPDQPVEVYVNDQKIAEWRVGETAVFAAALPNEITKAGGTITILFKTPKATSPEALGLNADARILGICLVDLEFSKG
jgi:hypothetical protein